MTVEVLSPRSTRLTLTLFVITMAVSAVLMFLLEPMAAKMVLPLLGGAPAVWNTCVVFFQAMLLAGYAYAHGGPQWLGLRQHALIHAVLLAVPLIPIGAIKATATKPDEPKTPEHPCPCCGGRMIIIETFERGCQPRYRPPPPAQIRIDTL